MKDQTSSGSNQTTSKSPWWQRKSGLILVTVLAALAVFGTTTQTWIHVAVNQGGVAQADLSIAGSKTAVAVSALALVGLAGSLAATIAGKYARIVTAAIVFFSAVGIIAIVLGIMADPIGAAMTQASAATGIEARPSNADLTVFPVLAVAAAAILAAASLLVLWFGRGWNQRTKYDAATLGGSGQSVEPVDEIDSWDRLSRGEDPTD